MRKASLQKPYFKFLENVSEYRGLEPFKICAQETLLICIPGTEGAYPWISISCLEMFQTVTPKIGCISDVCVCDCCANKTVCGYCLIFLIIWLIYSDLLYKTFKVTICHVMIHIVNATTKMVCLRHANIFFVNSFYFQILDKNGIFDNITSSSFYMVYLLHHWTLASD